MRSGSEHGETPASRREAKPARPARVSVSRYEGNLGFRCGHPVPSQRGESCFRPCRKALRAAAGGPPAVSPLAVAQVVVPRCPCVIL